MTTLSLADAAGERDTLSGLWKDSESEREPFIRRGRKAAFLTLPYLAPESTYSSPASQDLPYPLSTTGPDGVTNLAAKLTLGSFPPQEPFFRYDLDPIRVFQLGGTAEDIGAAKLAMSQRAGSIQRKLDTIGFRATAVEAFEHLLVTGNFLLRLGEDGKMKGFALDEFMVIRDGQDRPDVILVRETISRSALPDTARMTAESVKPDSDEAFLFTVAARQPGDTWDTWQEAGGVLLPDTTRTRIPDRDLPWIVLRMVPNSREDYGRSYVESVQGGLEALEGLEQSMADYAAIASKVVGINNPASGLRSNDITSAQNGQWLTGIAGTSGENLTFLTAGKLGDISAVDQLRQQTDMKLQRRFLLLTPVRDAERVTAEEILAVQRELNEALGGAFAVLAEEFQKPIAVKIERIMRRRGELDPIDDKVAGLKIVTGLDAVGRSREEATLIRWSQAGQAVLGEQGFSQRINGGEFLTRLAAAQGHDPTGLVLTEEQIQQQQSQQSQQQLLESLGPEALRQFGTQATTQQ